MRDENQLHAAVVELVAMDDARDQILNGAELVPGGQGRQGRHLQLRDQARCLQGRELPHLVDTGRNRVPRSPGSIRAVCFIGDNSVGEFYSVALTNNYQQADTGTKMIHVGKNTRRAPSSPRGSPQVMGRTPIAGQVKVYKSAAWVPGTTRNVTRFFMGDRCGAHTFPYHRGERALRPHRTRGQHLQGERRKAVLLPATRSQHRGLRSP